MTNTQLKEIRAKSGLSQKEFATKVGLSKDQIAARENGRTKISDEESKTIIAAFTPKKEEKPVRKVQQIAIVSDESLTRCGKMKNVANTKDEIKDLEIIGEAKNVTIGVVYKTIYKYENDEVALEKIYLAYPEHTMAATRYSKTAIKETMTSIIRKYVPSYRPDFAGKKLAQKLA